MAVELKVQHTKIFYFARLMHGQSFALQALSHTLRSSLKIETGVDDVRTLEINILKTGEPTPSLHNFLCSPFKSAHSALSVTDLDNIQQTSLQQTQKVLPNVGVIGHPTEDVTHSGCPLIQAICM